MKLRNTFIALLATASLFAACDDKKDDPKPKTGTVKGSFTPAAGGSMVYLITGTDTTKINPTSTGTYEKADVLPGTYSVAVKAKDGYEAPAPSSATITAGKTTDVPAITLTQIPANGKVSLTIDGTAYNTTPTPGTWAGRPDLVLDAGPYYLQIMLPTITGNGTFTLDNSYLGFYLRNLTAMQQWYDSFGGATGTLTVTSYNAATKKGNATFSFTLKAASSSYQNKTVSNGVLTGVKLAL